MQDPSSSIIVPRVRVISLLGNLTVHQCVSFMKRFDVGSDVILSRTPVRVSFCGGGTDLESFWSAHPEGGAVTSMTISSYIYVLLNRRFESSIRVAYTKTEIVENIDDVEHDLVREALQEAGLTSHIEVVTIADIPSRGSGLGSSSTLTVGLLNAVHGWNGQQQGPEDLARGACDIEVIKLGQPIGQQDQYAAAYGGLNHIVFHQDGTVSVEPITVSEEITDRIAEEFILIWTGRHRKASGILEEQSQRTSSPASMDRLIRMRAQALEVRDAFQNGDLVTAGSLLDKAWRLKRDLASNITDPDIDALHGEVMACGATGCKLLGAGGGGFLLAHGGSDLEGKVRSRLPAAKCMPLKIDSHGSILMKVTRDD